MFRITRFMQEIRGPSQDAPRRAPAGPVAPVGPVVIWNLVRRCNLTCRHCYSISADVDFPGELTTPEIFRTMDDLAAFRVPALILSGGEPLLHPDIFTISRRAKAMGFFVGLSTNGTLIDAGVAARIAEVGYDYVGISLDGRRATHDRFRRKEGAFDASLAALRLLRDAGVRVGVRFTLTQENAVDLPALLALLDDEAIDRFYLSHLNYAGRGDVNRRTDAAPHAPPCEPIGARRHREAEENADERGEEERIGEPQEPRDDVHREHERRGTNHVRAAPPDLAAANALLSLDVRLGRRRGRGRGRGNGGRLGCAWRGLLRFAHALSIRARPAPVKLPSCTPPSTSTGRPTSTPFSHRSAT